jgi:hypothetical protein
VLTFIAVGSTMISACACYGGPGLECAGVKLPDGGIVGASPGLMLCDDCTKLTDPSTDPDCRVSKTDGGIDGGP